MAWLAAEGEKRIRYNLYRTLFYTVHTQYKNEVILIVIKSKMEKPNFLSGNSILFDTKISLNK